MSDLKPCPFCGGEKGHDSAAHEDDELWCEHCDIELDDSWSYCPHCGARVTEVER